MNTYPPDGKYRIEADLYPDANGIYTIRVHLGDDHLTSICRYDREEAISKAHSYVEWHRDHLPAVEVIEL